MEAKSYLLTPVSSEMRGEIIFPWDSDHAGRELLHHFEDLLKHFE
jgi:hypothetical protein